MKELTKEEKAALPLLGIGHSSAFYRAILKDVPKDWNEVNDFVVK